MPATGPLASTPVRSRRTDSKGCIKETSVFLNQHAHKDTPLTVLRHPGHPSLARRRGQKGGGGRTRALRVIVRLSGSYTVERAIPDARTVSGDTRLGPRQPRQPQTPTTPTTDELERYAS